MARSGEPTVLLRRRAAHNLHGGGSPGPGRCCARSKQPRKWRASVAPGPSSSGIRHHIACLAAYLKRATDDGLIAIIESSDPAVAAVVPHGGLTPFITPNPIAAGLPISDDPLLVDVSTSITSMGYARQQMRAGKRLPGEWLIDAEGNPTTDPGVLFNEPKGALLPLGGLDAGHKGFALALLVEALTAGLAGHGRADPPAGWGGSVFVQVIDPEAFGGSWHSGNSWISSPAPRAKPPLGAVANRCDCPASAGCNDIATGSSGVSLSIRRSCPRSCPGRRNSRSLLLFRRHSLRRVPSGAAGTDARADASWVDRSRPIATRRSRAGSRQGRAPKRCREIPPRAATLASCLPDRGRARAQARLRREIPGRPGDDGAYRVEPVAAGYEGGGAVRSASRPDRDADPLLAHRADWRRSLRSARRHAANQSDSMNVALAMPSRFALRRARSTAASDTSAPKTSLRGRCQATARATAPDPLPRSRTRAGVSRPSQFSANSTNSSVSGRGIRTSRVISRSRPKNSRRPVR